MTLFQICGIEPQISFITESGSRICKIYCPKCDTVLKMSHSTNETNGKLSYSISNFKSHFLSIHGDDISTASSDSIISNISLADTPVTHDTPSGQQPRHLLNCHSCEGFKEILTKKDGELFEYSNRLKVLSQLETTISEKGNDR